MERQTLRPAQWLVVTDNDNGYSPIPNYVDLHFRDDQDDNLCSFCHNILYALDKIDNPYAMFWEDDDYYAPTFIQDLWSLMTTNDLAGLNEDVFYNLTFNRSRKVRNMSLASLACTGFDVEKVGPLLRSLALKDDVLIDGALWDQWNGSKALMSNWQADGRPLHIGLKGWGVGEPGLTMSHENELGSIDYGRRELEKMMAPGAFGLLQNSLNANKKAPLPLR